MFETVVILAIVAAAYYGYRWYKKNSSSVDSDLSDEF